MTDNEIYHLKECHRNGIAFYHYMVRFIVIFIFICAAVIGGSYYYLSNNKHVNHEYIQGALDVMEPLLTLDVVIWNRIPKKATHDEIDAIIINFQKANISKERKLKPTITYL